MSEVDTQSVPAWPLVTVVHVRAASAGEAVDIEEFNLRVASEIDTGEAGHSAGGVVVGVLNERDPDPYLDGLTVNQSLQEAALLLLAASFQEGDDGTGGQATIEGIELAILMAQEAVQTLKEV